MSETPDLKTPEGYAADVIAKAVRFTASLFLGRGKYDTREANSVAEVEAAAADLKAAHPDSAREPIITAFDEAGNSTVISGEPHAAHKARVKAADLIKAAKAKPAKAKPAKKAGKPAKAGKSAGKAGKAKAAPVTKAAPAGHHGERWTKEVEARWEEAAAKGTLPPAPDFSAPTHANYRKMRDRMVEAAEAGDLAALRAIEVQPVSSSRTILWRYRNYAVRALEVKADRSAKRKAKREAAAASPELVDIERPSS